MGSEVHGDQLLLHPCQLPMAGSRRGLKLYPDLKDAHSSHQEPTFPVTWLTQYYTALDVPQVGPACNMIQLQTDVNTLLKICVPSSFRSSYFSHFYPTGSV